MGDGNSDERVRFLIEQKISYLNTVGNVCMAWWVSSVVFCGSILAAVWLNRAELVESGVIKWLGFALAAFFATVVIYGVLIIRYLDRVHREVSDLASQLNFGAFLSTEIRTFRNAMINGTSSFAIILVAWLVLWFGLWAGYWVSHPPQAQPNNSLNPTRD